MTTWAGGGAMRSSVARRDGWRGGAQSRFRGSSSRLGACTAPTATRLKQWGEGSRVCSPVVEKLRDDLTANFTGEVMPTARNERFRFTDVAPLGKLELQAPRPTQSQGAVAALVAEKGAAESKGRRLVIVDGVVDEELSDTTALGGGGLFVGAIGDYEGNLDVQLGSIQKQAGQDVGDDSTFFWDLNASCSPDAVLVRATSGMEMGAVELFFVNTSDDESAVTTASYPRILISVADGAKCSVQENYVSLRPGASHFTNSLAEISLGDGAMLTHNCIQQASIGAHHYKTTLVTQDKMSSYRMVEVNVGAKFHRHDLVVDQCGAETETIFKTFSMVGKGQLHDLHSDLKLRHPGGRSDQLHKVIATDRTSRGVFDGRVTVAQAAQETDAAQLTRSLLLDKNATVNVKPNLQIHADSVACTHGATISDLDEEQLFYLQTRGISIAEARQTLVYSFGFEVAESLLSKSILKGVGERVRSLLEGT